MIESRQIVLKCESCRVQKFFTLNMTQLRKLSGESFLQLPCNYYSASQGWTAIEPLPAIDLDLGAPAKAKNTFLVDDDDLILKPLQEVLASWNSKVKISTNGDKKGEVKSFMDGTGCNHLYKPIQFLDFPVYIRKMITDELTASN